MAPNFGANEASSSHMGSGKELGGEEGPHVHMTFVPAPHTCAHPCMVVTGVTHKAALRMALYRCSLPLGGPVYWCLRAMHVLVPLQVILSLPL